MHGRNATRPHPPPADVEAALRLLEGRWKLVILFHLFGGKVMRFSDLERAIPNITQKMLGQQLRSLAVGRNRSAYVLSSGAAEG